MIAIVMRLGQEKVTSKLCMIATNYFTCLVMSWAMMNFGNPFPAESGLRATLGMGDDYDSKCHTLDEQFKPEGAYLGAQQTMLLALLCAGTEDVETIIE